MRDIFHIGHTDLRLFLKRKSAYVWLFGVPLVFIYIMGFAVRGPGDPTNAKAPVFVENLDSRFLGRVFLDELGAQGLWLVDPTNRDSAARVIRIPDDLTERVLRREPVKVEFTKRKDSAEADAALIEVRLVRALIALNGHILEVATRTNGPAELTEEALKEARLEPDPVVLDARFAGRKPVPTGFNFSLPGNLVMYLMMNLLIFGGMAMASERRNGVIRRMMVNPVSRASIVQGKIYGLMLLGGVQTIFFLVMGRLVFHVNLGANLPAVVVTLLLFTWVAGSIGVLIGSIVSSDDRVTGICVLVSLMMAAMGGCMWPLEVGPPVMKTIALCFPTGWALAALHQLISFGSGFEAVLKPIAVLLAFGMTANWLASRFFRG